MPKFNLLVILGTTASGKTRLAVQLARQLNGEIISADSRQVYRGLNIGSGKDLEEYEDIPYHLIDIVSPGYEFSVFDYQGCFFKSFEETTKGNKLPILAGGSALYVDSVLNGYRMIAVPENLPLREQLGKLSHEQLVAHLLRLKPKQHNTTDLLEHERLIRAIEIAEGERSASSTQPPLAALKPLIVGIQWQRSKTRERITQRLKDRLEQGLIEEVQTLHNSGVSWQTLEFYGLEYRFVARHLQNQLTYNDMFQQLNSAIHQFAKKQDTWLRRLQRNGHVIHWVNGEDDIFDLALNIIENTEG